MPCGCGKRKLARQAAATAKPQAVVPDPQAPKVWNGEPEPKPAGG